MKKSVYKKWIFLVLRYYDIRVIIFLKMMDWCIDIRNKEIVIIVFLFIIVKI